MIFVRALGVFMIQLFVVVYGAFEVLWNEWIRYSFNKFAAIDIDVCPKCQLISMNRPVRKPPA